MIAYHIDRRSALKPDFIIELRDHTEKFNDKSGTMNMLYPGGISNHGLLYHSLVPSPENAAFLESVFEYERRLNFPEKQSRFQSFFASETIEDALKWNMSFNKNGSCPIWEVEFNHSNYLKLDQSWTSNFQPGSPYISMANNANRYWSGELTEIPFMELLILPPIKIIRNISFVTG